MKRAIDLEAELLTVRFDRDALAKRCRSLEIDLESCEGLANELALARRDRDTLADQVAKQAEALAQVIQERDALQEKLDALWEDARSRD